MKKPIVKKADLNTKIGKYFIAKQQGKTKREAQVVAGFADTQHPTRIEATKTYQAIEQLHYKDELLKQISLRDIALEQIKVILQDDDLGAKNTAIKNAMDKIEADKILSDEADKVLVILR